MAESTRELTFKYPKVPFGRGPGFWLIPTNWVAARRHFRRDQSVEWRQRCEAMQPPTPSRSASFEPLLRDRAGGRMRFLILGDPGEGDHSQYALLPLIRSLKPDFMIINGDCAYPAGRADDYTEGFFLPYQGLGIPIWAVPGNHEYYSPNSGREFHDVFCSNARAQDWAKYGLKLVRQPGFYWELQSDTWPLVVIGLDSGMKAQMDPASSNGGDAEQIEWLKWRLQVAQDADRRVLALFHIPALVGEKQREQGLTQLHSALAASSAVRAVVTAHEHGFQYYSPGVFHRFAGSPAVAPQFPHYMVAGSSGAGLSAVTSITGSGAFPATRRFPDLVEWSTIATLASRGVAKLGASRTVGARVVGSAWNSLRRRLPFGPSQDEDLDKYLTLLCVDVTPKTIDVTPYLQPDLDTLYRSLSGSVTVDVQACVPFPVPADVDLIGPAGNGPPTPRTLPLM